MLPSFRLEALSGGRATLLLVNAFRCHSTNDGKNAVVNTDGEGLDKRDSQNTVVVIVHHASYVGR